MSVALCMSLLPVVLWILVGAVVVLLFFHAAIFSRLAFRTQWPGPDRTRPVSVVICARNEARNLQALIDMLMEQEHDEFEVVIVNDRSDDDTLEVLNWLKPKYPRLRVVNIQADEKFSYGKKIALGVGIRAAKHPHIILTDADCVPASRQWLSLMCAGFHDGRQIIIGHSPYEHTGGLTNVLERYDGTTKAMQYISFALAGLPYMGVGRNLGYTQEVFFSARGPRRHAHIMSGDDDLFINEVARVKNTSVMADQQAFMTTRATADLATWVRRKRRHFTTAQYYRFGHQLLLLLLPAARLLFWACIVALCIMGQWWWAVAALGVELLLFYPVVALALHRLKAGALLIVLTLPLEWLFLVLDPLLYTSTLIIKPRRWK